MLGPPTANGASGPAVRRREGGSALGRWLNVMLVLVLVSTLMRMFVIHDHRNDGDAFNDVVVVVEDDTDVTGIGVGPEGSVFVRDDDEGKDEGGRSPGKRTAVDLARPARVLEVRVFLGKTPLTHGDVLFTLDSKAVMGRIPPYQVVTLDGTNVAKVSWAGLHDFEGELRISASHTEKKPGCTPRDWGFSAKIAAPGPGQRWIGPDFVLESGKSYLVCSGRVVDESGMPIPGSTVALGSAITFTRDLTFVFGGTQYALGGLATASDGSFEMRNTAPSPKLKLSLEAQAPGHVLPQAVQFRPGATGLRIVMHRAGSVSGSLILPTGMDRSWISVGLLQDKGGRVVARAKLEVRGSPGEWTLDPVAPGRYTLRIAYLTMDQPLVEFRGVEVQAGQECRDVRIQNLDLRGLIRVIRVRVVPERPKGPLQCTLLCRTSDGAKDRRGRSIKLESAGTASLVIPTAGAHVRIEAKGYEPIDNPRVTEDTTFELQRLKALPRVEIRLVGGFPKKLPATIWMELVPAVGSGPRLVAKNFTLEGSFFFPEVRPGPYKARIYLKKERDKHAPRMLPDRDLVLQVRKADERQGWKVSFDHDRLLRFAQEGKMRMNAPRRRH